MIAVDTNLLIYAHRSDSPFHAEALAVLTDVAGGTWAVPAPCLHEFLAVSTHPRVFDPPSPMIDARQAVRGWLDSPTLTVLSETEGYWSVLDRILDQSRVHGPRVHDARIAALCLHHGVDELLSADRDFSRFPILVRNPLLA
ncbi:MAG: type II toxin-antitoxin system VapC family toxin [Myxococcota bacterium]